MLAITAGVGRAFSLPGYRIPPRQMRCEFLGSSDVVSFESGSATT